MYQPNIVDGVLTSRFNEIKTHMNHQLSFSPNSNQGHVLVDNQFYDFQVNKNGDLFSPEKIDGYDYFDGKSYLGHYNNLQFSPTVATANLVPGPDDERPPITQEEKESCSLQNAELQELNESE